MINNATISMDWGNLQFKAKDLILFIGYLVTGVLFISRITNSIERQGDKLSDLQEQVIELKNEGKGNTKESQAFLQSIQNQVNTNTQQILLLKQEVEMMKQYQKK